MKTIKSALSSKVIQRGHLTRLQEMRGGKLFQSSWTYRRFLKLRQQNLEVMDSSVGMQSLPLPPVGKMRVPVISPSQLDELGASSITRRFSPDYTLLHQRKSTPIHIRNIALPMAMLPCCAVRNSGWMRCRFTLCGVFI